MTNNQAAERDALREALKDMLSGWKYIRDTHGDLYGVGWNRAQDKAEAALAFDKPASSEEPVAKVHTTANGTIHLIWSNGKSMYNFQGCQLYTHPAAHGDVVLMSKAFDAACAFIDSHVADPDITAEMRKTYAEFERLRSLLGGEGQ